MALSTAAKWRIALVIFALLFLVMLKPAIRQLGGHTLACQHFSNVAWDYERGALSDAEFKAKALEVHEGDRSRESLALLSNDRGLREEAIEKMYLACYG